MRKVVGAFLVGAVAGGAVVWWFAVANERWRRIRRDLKAARNGLKTLRTMWRRQALTQVEIAIGVVVVVGVLLVVLAAT